MRRKKVVDEKWHKKMEAYLMGQAMDKIVESAGKAAQEAAKFTGKLVADGRTQANRLALQARQAKLQRQLGAAVYALKKNDEENEQLVAFYVEELDKVKAALARLQPPKRNNTAFYVTGSVAEVQEDAMFCGCDSE